MYMSGDEQDAALDYDAVQRGDAEMENRMNRVIRACIDLGERNPIVSIHDQGAGGEPKSLVPHVHTLQDMLIYTCGNRIGNGNVLKEISDPLGAVLEIRSLPVGDDTLSILEVRGYT